jgi:hypothetical protein
MVDKAEAFKTAIEVDVLKRGNRSRTQKASDCERQRLEAVVKRECRAWL